MWKTKYRKDTLPSRLKYVGCDGKVYQICSTHHAFKILETILEAGCTYSDQFKGRCPIFAPDGFRIATLIYEKTVAWVAFSGWLTWGDALKYFRRAGHWSPAQCGDLNLKPSHSFNATDLVSYYLRWRSAGGQILKMKHIVNPISGRPADLPDLTVETRTIYRRDITIVVTSDVVGFWVGTDNLRARFVKSGQIDPPWIDALVTKLLSFKSLGAVENHLRCAAARAATPHVFVIPKGSDRVPHEGSPKGLLVALGLM